MEKASDIEARSLHRRRARRYLESLPSEARFLLSLRRYPVWNWRKTKRNHRVKVGRHRLEVGYPVIQQVTLHGRRWPDKDSGERARDCAGNARYQRAKGH